MRLYVGLSRGPSGRGFETAPDHAVGDVSMTISFLNFFLGLEGKRPSKVLIYNPTRYNILEKKHSN